MNAPAFPFLAGDIDWVEAPLIIWLVMGVLTMLVTRIRFGGDAPDVMRKYWIFWLGTLVVALGAMVIIYLDRGGGP